LDDLEGYMTKGGETVNDNKPPMLPVCPTCGRRNFPHCAAARKHLKHCAFAKNPRWVRKAERNQKLPGLLCCFCGQVFSDRTEVVGARTQLQKIATPQTLP
jgi:hypothetical protein